MEKDVGKMEMSSERLLSALESGRSSLKNTDFSEPPLPFILVSWASQSVYSVHVMMALIWSCHESVLKTGYSARWYQKGKTGFIFIPWGRSALAVLDHASLPLPFAPKFRAWSNLSKSCFIVLTWLHGFKMAIYHGIFCFLWKEGKRSSFL